MIYVICLQQIVINWHQILTKIINIDKIHVQQIQDRHSPRQKASAGRSTMSPRVRCHSLPLYVGSRSTICRQLPLVAAKPVAIWRYMPLTVALFAVNHCAICLFVSADCNELLLFAANDVCEKLRYLAVGWMDGWIGRTDMYKKTNIYIYIYTCT